MDAKEIAVDRTIAGTFLFPKSAGPTLRDVPGALWWNGTDRITHYVVSPYAAGGSFVPMENDSYRHATSLREALAVAARFFGDSAQAETDHRAAFCQDCGRVWSECDCPAILAQQSAVRAGE